MSTRRVPGRLIACSLLAAAAACLNAGPAAARVTITVNTRLADQNVHVNGVWIGRHGGAWFGQTRKLARTLQPLECRFDDSPRAQLVHGNRAVFDISGLTQSGVCWRDAIEFSTVHGRRDRVRMEFGTITIGRRTPAAVRRRITYLRETAATVTYGVARVGDICHPGRVDPSGRWQVTLTVSKRTHKATSVRVFSGWVEGLCP